MKCQLQLNIGQKCNDFEPNLPEPQIPFGSNYFIICKGSKCMGNETYRVCSTYRELNSGSTCNFDEQCKFGLICDSKKNICIKPAPKVILCPGYSKNCSYVDEKCICESSGGGGHDILAEKGSCQKVIEDKKCWRNGNDTAIDSFKNVIEFI